MDQEKIGTEVRPLKVAVVGAGPSGFYAIQGLYKSKECHARVDLFDRLPTPFGLVRGGVAPDHQKIKSVVQVYERLASDERTRFFGHVALGVDVTIEELMDLYDAVIIATGNESDRKLGIEGEDLKGVYSATEFVGWYNGHPDFQDREFGLDSAHRVVVVGNGNVAMDVSRVLVRSPDELETTDITNTAVAALRESQVREVVLLGRRGPAQAAFAPKEIRELGEVEGCHLAVDSDDMQFEQSIDDWLEEHGGRDARKNVNYLREVADTDRGGAERIVRCAFLTSPVEFCGADGQLDSVTLEKNELYIDDRGHPRPRGTGARNSVEAQLVFKAIGYRGTPIPGVPFHERWGIIPNDEGRVIESENGARIKRMYVVGWAKRGPTGLIGTNNGDAKATVACLIEDWAAGHLGGPRAADDIAEILASRHVDYVRWQDWKNLDALEQENGTAAGKIREKFTSVEAMMNAIRGAR